MKISACMHANPLNQHIIDKEMLGLGLFSGIHHGIKMHNCDLTVGPMNNITIENIFVSNLLISFFLNYMMFWRSLREIFSIFQQHRNVFLGDQQIGQYYKWH